MEMMIPQYYISCNLKISIFRVKNFQKKLILFTLNATKFYFR